MKKEIEKTRIRISRESAKKRKLNNKNNSP